MNRSGMEPLIPQMPPMRTVRVLKSVRGEADAGGAVTLALADQIFAGSDCRLINPLAMLEMIAQSFAAYQGATGSGDEPQPGFLVGVRDFEVCCAFNDLPEPGDLLEVRVNALEKIGDFSLANGEVWRGASLLARAEIKVWVPGEKR